MSRRVSLPDRAHVVATVAEITAECRKQGSRPTVVAVARRLELSPTTFWRYFRDEAEVLVAEAARRHVRDATESEPCKPASGPDAAQARLRRQIRELQAEAAVAAATLMYLTAHNAHLQDRILQLEGVVPIHGNTRGSRPTRN